MYQDWFSKKFSAGCAMKADSPICQPPTSPAAAHRAAALRRLCVQRGLPLGELARRAHVSRTTLHYLSNGATVRPHAATLARIAEVLGVDPRMLDGSDADRYARESRNPEVGSPDETEASMLPPGPCLLPAEQINAKRAVIHKLHVILETQLREAACEIIERMYEMVRAGKTVSADESVVGPANPDLRD
jgi:transcriptional regulator with XRE-family HTH domain